VFTYVDTQNLGVQYASTPDHLHHEQLDQCFNIPPPLIVNIPIVYDIIAHRALATWLYNIQEYRPTVERHRGSYQPGNRCFEQESLRASILRLSEHALEVEDLLRTASSDSGTDRYQWAIHFSNIPPELHDLGTYPDTHVFRTNVIVSVGATTIVNLAMSPVSAPGLLCLVPPIANPLP